ncbi:MAG: hypothetical protein OHK93_001745 [Ramalina farinacea]|uniref:tetrahydrofolate synthase n=1 Tax=Ramalina farinacea TaxID=258253 RepID=A0AA43QST3_9LECA|nr:hypothetical protein [Ramalina farinacea]
MPRKLAEKFDNGLQDILYSKRDLDRLNVIHVAGTKGKGSTCAFTRSFLEARGKKTGYPGKVGLYTSPHLRVIRERIQINSQLIQKDLFAKYVYEVWNKLEAKEDLPKPRYLQLLLMVAIHTFIREKVDVAVCETHHGGEYDATNVFPHPVATGITPIGMDHMAQLGPSIENISWHKSGIFKPGAPAFSSAQEDKVAEVLRSRAMEKNVSLDFVNGETVSNSDLVALKPAVQRQNASLALKLANAFLLQKDRNRTTLTSNEIREGVEAFTWIGRFQQIIQENYTWFLDGAHNEMSVPYAAQWFADVTKESRYEVYSHGWTA